MYIPYSLMQNSSNCIRICTVYFISKLPIPSIKMCVRISVSVCLFVHEYGSQTTAQVKHQRKQHSIDSTKLNSGGFSRIFRNDEAGFSIPSAPSYSILPLSPISKLRTAEGKRAQHKHLKNTI